MFDLIYYVIMCDFVTIFTDGSCSKNPGPGGWAAILQFGEKLTQKISGHKLHTTNNIMELTAALSALQYLDKSYNVNLYTDSKYLKDGMTKWVHIWKRNNWSTSSKKIVKNLELWKKLAKISDRHKINWLWIKAHSGNYYNSLVDQLAVSETHKASLKL